MIDKYILELLTVEGFIKRYLEMLTDYGSCQHAYEAAERQYEANFGKRKYSDYDTFRTILSRHVNKKRKK